MLEKELQLDGGVQSILSLTLGTTVKTQPQSPSFRLHIVAGKGARSESQKQIKTWKCCRQLHMPHLRGCVEPPNIDGEPVAPDSDDIPSQATAGVVIITNYP